MKNVFAETIENVRDSREYEVTFSTRVTAKNIGDAIRQAADKLTEGSATVKDVKECQQ
jgi:phage-related minor tail protein